MYRETHAYTHTHTHTHARARAQHAHTHTHRYTPPPHTHLVEALVGREGDGAEGDEVPAAQHCLLLPVLGHLSDELAEDLVPELAALNGVSDGALDDEVELLRTEVAAQQLADVLEDATCEVDVLRVVHVDEGGRDVAGARVHQHVLLGHGVLDARGAAQAQCAEATRLPRVVVEVHLGVADHGVGGWVEGLLPPQPLPLHPQQLLHHAPLPALGARELLWRCRCGTEGCGYGPVPGLGGPGGGARWLTHGLAGRLRLAEHLFKVRGQSGEKILLLLPHRLGVLREEVEHLV